MGSSVITGFIHSSSADVCNLLHGLDHCAQGGEFPVWKEMQLFPWTVIQLQVLVIWGLMTWRQRLSHGLSPDEGHPYHRIHCTRNQMHGPGRGFNNKSARTVSVFSQAS